MDKNILLYKFLNMLDLKYLLDLNKNKYNNIIKCVFTLWLFLIILLISIFLVWVYNNRRKSKKKKEEKNKLAADESHPYHPHPAANSEAGTLQKLEGHITLISHLCNQIGTL